MTGRAPDNARDVDRRGTDGITVGALWARVRRYWALVLLVTWVAALGAVVATERTPATYVGRTSLIVSSDDRSPDQDAVLVQGYIAYFNDGSFQQQLLRTAGVPDDVSVSAQAAAASPIVVISATTNDPATAQQDAITVARAFQDEINRVHTENTREELVQLQDQLDTALASDNPEAQSVVVDLQNQIEQLQADQVNVLQELQVQGGVSVLRPSLSSNLLPAVAGGLLLGVLAALVLSAMSRRLRTGQDVADKLGLRTLVELPRPRGKAGGTRQAQRLGQLANIVRARLAGPGVVAVAQPEEGYASALVARELAREWATQGYPTVLLTTGAAEPQVRSDRLQRLSLLELAPRSVDGTHVLSVSKVRELLLQEALVGHYVVVEAPAVVQSPAAQAICHAADQTILVVDTKVARVPVAREAVAVLREMGVTLLGAVVASVNEERDEQAQGTATTPRPHPADEAHTEDVRQRTGDEVEHYGRPPVDDSRSAVLRRNAESDRA